MKRKFFSFAAAIVLMASTVLPVSAASQGCREPSRFCFVSGSSVCVPCPDQNGTPSIPNAPEQDNTPETDLGAMSHVEQAACALVNDRREANGLEPLTISEELSVKARIKSRDMKDNGYFDHNSPVYGSPFALMQSLGITYRSAGENIAMGYKTAEAVVNAWMNSPGHRANILSTRYDTFGIGHVDGYWTQWFIG